MSTRFLMILCAVVCSAALLFGYWAEGMRMKETTRASQPAPIKQQVSEPISEPHPNLHPAAAAGIVDFVESAKAVGAAAEAYENPDGDGSAYQEDVPLGLVYEEAMPNIVMSP